MHMSSFMATHQQLDLVKPFFYFPPMKWERHFLSGCSWIISLGEHFFYLPTYLIYQWSPLSLVFLASLPFNTITPALVIYCFIMIYQLKAMHIYYLTQFSWIRNLGVAKPGNFGSRSLLRLWSRCQPQLTIIWKLDWGWKTCSKMVHLDDCWQEASVPC